MYFFSIFRARANVNLVTLQGRTPLRIALLEGFLDIAGILMDNGADIDYIDTDSRYPPPGYRVYTQFMDNG